MNNFFLFLVKCLIALLGNFKHLCVLHEAGCYKGFCYLSEHDLPEEVKPGIRYYGIDGISDEDRFDDTDRTRVQYFI